MQTSRLQTIRLSWRSLTTLELLCNLLSSDDLTTSEIGRWEPTCLVNRRSELHERENS